MTAGIAIPAGDALAVSREETQAFAARALERGDLSLWLVAESREQSMALPLTAAALGVGLDGCRLGIALLLHDDLARMTEDLCVLDNVLGGRLEVAVALGRDAGGSPVARLGTLRRLLAGEPVDLGAGRRGVRVTPPSAQRPLEPAAFFAADASLHDLQRALAAGFPVVIPHRLALALPATWRGRARVTETVTRAELDEPLPPGVSARLLLASLRDERDR
jgi:hypothetical protein